MELADDRLHLAGSDLDLTVQVEIGVVGLEPGVCVVPARLGTDIVRSLEAGASKGGYRLSVANRLWGPKGYHYRPEFLATTRDQYGAELAEVDFNASEQARRTINDWVS